MRVVVDLLSPSRALVTLTPSLLSRMLFGAKAETRNAARRWAGWEYEDGKFMEPRVELELHAEAMRAAKARRRSG